MFRLLSLLVVLVTRLFRSRRDMVLENLALRQQLSVFKRQNPRPAFGAPDKLFWVMLTRLWIGWSRALILIQPETVIRWLRKGFKLYWTRLSRHRTRVGRGCVSRELRELIFRIAAVNRTWGAPHIHGELKMLGYDVSGRTVQRWMRKAPLNPEPAKLWSTARNAAMQYHDETGEVRTAVNRPALLPETLALSGLTFSSPRNLPQERYHSMEPVLKKEIPVYEGMRRCACSGSVSWT
jgi:hypothetical protein